MSALGHERTYAVQKAMSALPPKADMCSALGHVCFGPKADSCTAEKKLISGGARSGRRAADQPHRTGQSHAHTIRIGRERLLEGGDGGRDDLCWLVAQPTV